MPLADPTEGEDASGTPSLPGQRGHGAVERKGSRGPASASGPRLVRFGVSIPGQLVGAFDRRIRSKGYRSRSEAIRDIIRDYLVAGEWEGHGGPVVGTITVLYDHATRELPQALTELQHRHHDDVRCATHVHLDEHHCLEVIVVKGRARRVREIADRLISVRGVKHGKLVCTTTGGGLA